MLRFIGVFFVWIFDKKLFLLFCLKKSYFKISDKNELYWFDKRLFIEIVVILFGVSLYIVLDDCIDNRLRSLYIGS